MRYSKRMGQVFLQSRRIAEYEVDLLGVPGTVLEIGPGHGVLTKILIDRGFEVTAVEKDRYIFQELQPIRSRNLNLINMDFLDMAPGSYDYIIGNIPYSISSPIIFKLYEFEFQRSVIMVQKEFAEKIAYPNDMSRLHVNAHVRYSVELKRYVSRRNFNPQPEVDSAILVLEKKKYEEPYPMDFLDSVLIQMFSKKRKKLSNIFDICPEDLADKRPSNLTVSEILGLARLLFDSGFSARR
ncbi:rRNA adenine dimethyltransferase family protein [Thermoplasma sp.]|uniref:ribosomal RNA small subunit methyltransferase A n=1 Tax=Thermoplasma sp. TaxID=1973142 RepID=UPI001272AC95|nr:rRNA adenine dimethyltransferase family protein [Thermoplasma sp.]KAA8922065.1 MAG: rRNA dimethyladenosine transferase [Thermoplasma sp.]